MAKSFGVTPDYILYKMSWANLNLYSAAIPSYKKEKKEDDFDESLDANDPNNFQGSEEIVRR